MHVLRALPLILVLFSCGSPAPQSPDRVAGRLLDDSVDRDERTELARSQAGRAPAVLGALLDGMEPGTEEEYRRIPWLWRVSRAAGEANDEAVLRGVLEVSLPAEGEPLEDWQAVVVGGGVIGGLTAAGAWPRERVETILEDDPELMRRWSRSIELSEAMADDPSVPEPTRYDALRMIAMADWERAAPQLIRYLPADSTWQLQMGAVSGLSDVREPRVDSVLLAHFDAYTARNRGLALDALLRTEDRADALLDAVEDNLVPADSLGTERVSRLRDHSSEHVRERARVLLPAN